MPGDGPLLRPATSGATRLAGVIGAPIRHSLSPAIFNAAFDATGLDWVYAAFEVAEGDAPAALAGVRSLGLGGVSVTMPHKGAVVALVDELTPDAAALGAVNCVVPVGGGRLVGDNTDGPGFVASLRDAGVEVRGARCAVVGAGGAGRAVVRALAGAGAREVVVVNRTPARARDAAGLAGSVGMVGMPVEVATADLVVNATSVGMAGTAGAGRLPLDPGLLGEGQVVADLVYEPARTPLLEAAEAQGATPVGGIGMLVHQAAAAFARWTGQEAPLGAMRAAAEASLAVR